MPGRRWIGYSAIMPGLHVKMPAGQARQSVPGFNPAMHQLTGEVSGT
jgi:hypothetical protein